MTSYSYETSQNSFKVKKSILLCSCYMQLFVRHLEDLSSSLNVSEIVDFPCSLFSLKCSFAPITSLR